MKSVWDTSRSLESMLALKLKKGKKKNCFFKDGIPDNKIFHSHKTENATHHSKLVFVQLPIFIDVA